MAKRYVRYLIVAPFISDDTHQWIMGHSLHLCGIVLSSFAKSFKRYGISELQYG